MLPREKRLNKTRDFERAYQKGRRLSSQSFNMSFTANGTRLTRIGVVAGKKFSKKATERNRAKRIFREAAAAEHDSISPGVDIILFVKKTNQGEPKLDAIRKEFLEALGKAGVKK